jgi:hypothetical protein
MSEMRAGSKPVSAIWIAMRNTLRGASAAAADPSVVAAAPRARAVRRLMAAAGSMSTYSHQFCQTMGRR